MMLLFWSAWKDSILWDLNTKRSPQETRGSADLLRRLKESNQQGTMEMLGSRWRILTLVRGVCALGRIAWYTIQGE